MIGKTVSHYRIVEKLGEGGMGVVYKADDLKLNRSVALKFLSTHLGADESDRKRFFHEAKAASALDHNNICNIHAIEETDEGQIFIVMAYYEGRSLKQRIEESPLRLHDVVEYSIQIAEGLRRAHQKEIVHRDLKPANIFITNEEQIKIIDFGLAKLSGFTKITRTGRTVGTIAYMSPEHARGEEVDHRTDIWALGVIMYEMLTGTLPFKSSYAEAVVYSILNEVPKPITSLVPGVPADFELLIGKAMEKRVQDRYQSIEEMLHDLKRIQQDLEDRGPYRIGKRPLFKRLKRTLYRVAAFVFLLIVLMYSLTLFELSVPAFIQGWIGHRAVPHEKHIAILPFTSIGGTSEDHALVDGFLETLTSKITQLEKFHGSLLVVPVSEIRFEAITSISEARRRFGVNLAVTGSTQFRNGNIRLTLNLVDAVTLRNLRSWTDEYNLSNMIIVEDRAVLKLTEMLELELPPVVITELASEMTTDSTAYAHYLKGRGFLSRFERRENIERAIDMFHSAIRNDSSFAVSYAGLAEAYLRYYEDTWDSKLVDNTVEYSRKALEINDKLAPVHVTLGMINLRTGRYEEAIADFDRALRLDPHNAEAYRELARAYESQGSMGEAERTYKQAIQIKPEYWAGYNDLGVFYLRHSRYNEAIDEFKQVIVLTPDNYRGYMNLGSAYLLLGYMEDAREMYERSLSLVKTYDASANLGTLHYIAGRYTDAARTYELALELNDKDYLVWGNLASAYYWAPGERGKAQETYKRAIELAKERMEINPHDPLTITKLAEYYGMIDDREKAYSYIREALSQIPNDTSVMFRAGTIYERFGERDKALYWIGKALQMGHSRSEILNQPDLYELYSDDRFQKMIQELPG